MGGGGGLLVEEGTRGPLTSMGHTHGSSRCTGTLGGVACTGGPHAERPWVYTAGGGERGGRAEAGVTDGML